MVEELESTAQLAEDNKVRAEVRAQALSLEIDRVSAQKEAEAEDVRRQMHKQQRESQVREQHLCE
jgi:hypothetical protein